MNEPKKKEILQAIHTKWPDARAVKINHRKHTAQVFFNLKKRDPRDFTLAAKSHRELLASIK